MTKTEAETAFAKGAIFLRSVVSIEGLPPAERAEIALAGRSNVGKSSLLNALFDNKTLARTSKTPGRTQALNFFSMGETLYLIDMPGFGYAKQSRKEVKAWQAFSKLYLANRPTLKRVFLLIDSRHGFKSTDKEMMQTLNATGLSFQIILTKTDEPSPAELQKRLTEMQKEAAKYAACHTELLPSSAHKKHGLEEIRASIWQLAER
ncbi:MAG: ribosome biogenesis GTP-binding protein YihA/YsxC [Parvibaculales bacterium]